MVLHNDRLAVASTSTLTVWQANDQTHRFVAPLPAPGIPRLSQNEILWGPNIVNLASGKITPLPAAYPEPIPGGGERANLYAWNQNGSILLGAFSGGDRSAPTRLTLYNGRTGALIRTIYKGDLLPPGTAWMGSRAIVAGFGNPKIFDQSGDFLAELSLNAGTIGAFDSTQDARRLVIVSLNRELIWIDTASWTILDRWPGPWLHAAVSPDGSLVFALKFGGTVHAAAIENDKILPLETLKADPHSFALAVSATELVALGAGELHRAAIHRA